MTDKNTDIQDKVMADITSGRVKLRSRFVFLAEKLGLGSAVVLSIFGAVLICTLALFYLSASDTLTYLHFGNSGIYAFLDSFPYGLVVVLIGVILLAGYLLKKTELIYKYSYAYVALGLLFVIITGGAALAATNVAEKLEAQSFIHPFIKWSLEKRTYGVSGRVLEVAPMTMLVQTPQGLLLVHLEYAVKPLPILEPGLFVVTVGKMNPPDFWAEKVKVVSPNEIRLLRRQVIERHGMEMKPPAQMRWNKMTECSVI